MSYREDFKIKDAMLSLYNLGRDVSKNVFTGSRPQATPEQMKEFVVVSIPSRLESSTYGGGFGMTSAFCNIEIYVKHKKGDVEDQVKMDEMLEKALSVFPYSDGNIQMYRPSVMLRGSDGLGFSAMLVRAEMVIK